MPWLGVEIWNATSHMAKVMELKNPWLQEGRVLIDPVVTPAIRSMASNRPPTQRAKEGIPGQVRGRATDAAEH